MKTKHEKDMKEYSKRRLKAVKLWDNGKGKTQQQIADTLGKGCTRQAVSQWLIREAKIKTKKEFLCKT